MRSARARRAAARLLVPLLLAMTAPALAQPAAPREPTPEEKALAEALFQDGRKLMDAEQFAEACAKLAESQRLDPSGGTLLNLANCHEKDGKTASAWVEFIEAASMSDAAGKPDRAEYARKRAAALEAQLSRLVLEVSTPAPGLVLRLNGKELSAAAAAGTGMPVDPGEHTVEATAPGKKPWSERLRIDAEQPSTKRVTIPALEDAPKAPPPPERKVVAPLVPAATPETPAGGTVSLRTLGFVAGGVGLVGIGVGAVFGAMTLSRAGDVEEGCQDGCNQDEVALNDKAYTSATISTVAFGAGLAFLGAGAALVLLSGPSQGGESAIDNDKNNKRAASRLWVAPQVGGDGAQVTLGGRW